jgi:enoyl-CoA hydratase
MSDFEFLRTDREGSIAILTIDRQDKLNALSTQVLDELGRAFHAVHDDDDVRGIIITGAGEKAFVAGADIGVLATMDPLTGVVISRQGQDVFRALEKSHKPVLAAVGGFALGGGCELAMACHIRLASENAVFGLPEVGLGIIPGYGGTVRLARLVGLGRAIEFTLTGDMVKAERAAEIGLASGVVPRADLMDEAMEMMRKITSKGPLAVRMALESIYAAQDTPTEDALLLESNLFGLLASTADMREGMGAFLEKRAPDFQGR